MQRLRGDYFQQSPVKCARGLIGAVFEWRGCRARIIETEAYAAVGDPACHTFSRPSARDFVALHEAGCSYVYLNYGVHWLFNILVKGPKGDGFVLFRALEPVFGIEIMRRRRVGRLDRELCSGPGKLTQALGITGEDHGVNFLSDRECSIGMSDNQGVAADGRIGISKARRRPWRFSEIDNPLVSQKPRD